MRSLSLFVVLLAGQHTVQAFYIHLHGMVTHHFTGDPMGEVQVRMVKDSIERETMRTKANGRYEFYLERGYDYSIWFYKPGWITKHVRIDATAIPLVPDVPYYEMDLQITFFEWRDSLDLSVFDEPVALATYRHSVRNLSWNVDYTEAMRPRVARTMLAYEKALRGYVPVRRKPEDTVPSVP
ncbi:MAG: hypothetical protein JNM31_06250 [Flavobacteriales bacterium]|nr:hypothetical protein [Flavobacteriales bacterium]